MSLKFEQYAEASVPLLISVTEVENTLSSKKYVIYYEIPAFPNTFRSIDNLEEIFLPSPFFKFKILNLQQPNEDPLIKEAEMKKQLDKSISIQMKIPDGFIIIKGKIVNKSESQSNFYSLSILDMQKYSDFYAFRKKYKTLQNITRKQEFNLDHRLAIQTISNTFYFSLDVKELNLKHFFTDKKLKVRLQQIFEIEQWQNVSVVQEETINIEDLAWSGLTQFEIMGKLKLKIVIQLVKNENISLCDLVSLRVLESNKKGSSILIGTENFQKCAKVEPLLDEQFYDYEYGFLKRNLASLDQNSIYEHLNKLSPAFPHYPHFKNQNIIQTKSSKYLIFTIGHSKIRIPLFYILKGFNVFNTQDTTIKFLIETHSQRQINSQQQHIQARIFYELKFLDIWNLGSLNIQESYFEIKIISSHHVYSIPFHQTKVDSSTFKKQSKQLEIKNQYSQTSKQKMYTLTSTSEKNKLNAIKTDQLLPFYLLDFQSSQSVSFQISTQTNIHLIGTISRSQILEKNFVILTSHDNFKKIILVCKLDIIEQRNKSLKSMYKVRHRLYFTDDSPCDDTVYDLQIRKKESKKKLKTKISPEIKSESLTIIREFEDHYFQYGSSEIDLQVIVRKMFFDEELETFDNSQALSKRIVVNADANTLLEKNCSFLRIKGEQYHGINFDFYDTNIKKKLKLYIEIFCCQFDFFDLQTASYTIKIPHLLWQFNSLDNNSQISMEFHYNSKKKKSEKINIIKNSEQQYNVPFYNYKDGISIIIDGECGYAKVYDVMTVRCDIVKESIGWIDDSSWYLGIIRVSTQKCFYFLIKCIFDPRNREERPFDGSEKSDRTVDKQHSDRSYGKKIDPLAKTISNMDVFKLKKQRNDLITEGRQLTTRYVKKQQMIIALNKKLLEIEELLEKRKKLQKGSISLGKDKDVKKMKSLYRSICQCGAKNPQFQGFCGQCLKKLKKKYEIYLKQYRQKSYVYEQIIFKKFNSKEKLMKIKNKLSHYQKLIKSGKNISEQAEDTFFKSIQEKQQKRKVQQLKIELFRLEEDRKNFAETSNYQQNYLEDMIRKQDREIQQASQQLEKVSHELNDLKQTIERNKKSFF